MDSDTGTATRLRYRKGSVPGNPVSVSLTDESESSRRSRSDFPTSNVKSWLYLMKNVSLGSQSQYIAGIRIILFVIPSSVDPLAFYIPAINDDKKCLNLNKQFPSTVFAFSLACKIFVVIISLIFMIAHLMFKRGNWQRYKLCSFLIDFLISVPVLEMVNMTGSGLWDAINIFKLVIVIQYVARIVRIYSSFSRAKIRPRKLVEATWPRVAFNLFLYLQAANVFGGLWYFMAIKREIECWNKASINHTGQRHCYFNCNDSLEDYTFVSELCPTKKRNTTIHDFGIFHGALESGIVEDTNILQKFLHCFVWGLRNLSNLGHNLQTSSDLRENIFVILLVNSGLMLIVLLIGNLQTYLLSRTGRLNEMTKQPREIEEWEPFQKISKDLQQQVKKYKSYIWRKTNHIDVESLLNNLPKELRMEIKRELCWPLLKKVQECMMLKEETLDALCDRVKPAFFTDHTYILREGDPIDEMIFVLQGKLLTYTFKDITSGTTSSDNKRDDSHTAMKNDHLQDGDLYGEELIDWALRDRFSISLDIPKSNRTIQALTNVEAFILMVDDLKIVDIDMMSQAARVIQLAWRRHHTRRPRWNLKDRVKPGLGAVLKRMFGDEYGRRKYGLKDLLGAKYPRKTLPGWTKVRVKTGPGAVMKRMFGDEYGSRKYGLKDLLGAKYHRILKSQKNSRFVFFEGCNLVFDLEELLRASAEVLGKGAFGTAYKAALEDASTVVVKRLKKVNVGKREFEQQMEIVGSIRNENVAALRAYYYSKYYKLLVYDYYEQGSVSEMLHGRGGGGRSSLDWETRVRIAIGAARGIAHIHTENGGKLVHGGIKASNIFLNSQGDVSVSDVGLAALMSPMPPPAMQAAGYCAPEVTDTQKATQASDIYSFGVLLLELLSGKSPMHATGGEEDVHLVRWVNSVVREETAEVFDVELLRYPNIQEEMVEMLQIGMACVVRMPEQRPKMVDVVKMVEEIRRVRK